MKQGKEKMMRSTWLMKWSRFFSFTFLSTLLCINFYSLNPLLDEKFLPDPMQINGKNLTAKEGFFVFQTNRLLLQTTHFERVRYAKDGACLFWRYFIFLNFCMSQLAFTHKRFAIFSKQKRWKDYFLEQKMTIILPLEKKMKKRAKEMKFLTAKDENVFSYRGQKMVSLSHVCLCVWHSEGVVKYWVMFYNENAMCLEMFQWWNAV